MKTIKILIYLTVMFFAGQLFAQKILIPMDLSQTDHLKSYGAAYWFLDKGRDGDWLLNYRGGSFMFDYEEILAQELRIRGVSFENISGSQAAEIYAHVQSEDNNTEVIRLEKAPKIAVYATPGTQPWDDAVLMALEYAEVPYDLLWDEEVLAGKLEQYDWVHLHHEDFTGQYGKFYRSYANTPWYIEQVTRNENLAKKLGYKKVSEMKKDVVLKVREYVSSGGFLFAMCSATDTFDITLAAMNIDICANIYDGDPADPQANEKLNYDACFAFENFKLIMDPYMYEFSELDITPNHTHRPEVDYFTLFEFSAKYDPVPTMLTQNHANVISGFMGQTTAFHKKFIKKHVIIMGEREGTDEIKYIHGNFGKGFFTFYAGHDPEDYRHFVGDPPTELQLHKNSPGYRLILNNILFPAAKKKKQKT